MLDLNRCLKIDTGVSVILIYPGNLHSTYRTYTGIYFFLVFFSFFSFFFLSQATIFFFFFLQFLLWVSLLKHGDCALLPSSIGTMYISSP
jgi:hypothetical protein